MYRLPYTLRILLENVLRHEDGTNVTADDVEAVAAWDASAEPSQEISFTPGRVLLQDFTGVPAVVDLAAMRDAMRDLGGDPERINPLCPAELVIDHSVQVDEYATRLAIFAERRARVRAQPGALRVPALGAGRLRRLQGRPSEHRASSTRSTSSSSPGSSRTEAASPSPTRSSERTRTRR